MMEILSRRIGDFDILIPKGHIFSYDVPIWYDYFPIGLIMFSIKNIKNCSFVDIGANVGDSLSLIRTHNKEIPVICVEPSELFFKLLTENSKQFKNTTLLNGIIVPKHLENSFSFDSNNQTGTTLINKEETKKNLLKMIIDLKSLFNPSGATILKTDTDGFDLHIVKECIKIKKENNFDLPLIYFEGPTQNSIINKDFDEWFELFEILIKNKYKLLVIQNNGLPYANTSDSINAIRSVFMSLHSGFFHGRAVCHYFDIIAYEESISNDKIELKENWPTEWNSNYFKKKHQN